MIKNMKYYKNKIMVNYFEDENINLMEIAYKYLSKDELKHFKELNEK